MAGIEHPQQDTTSVQGSAGRMDHLVMCGPLETRLRETVRAVRCRVAYPRKSPIVVKDTGVRLIKPIRAEGCHTKPAATRYYLDEADVRRMFVAGFTYAQMAETFGVPLQAMRHFLRRRGWKR